MEWVRVSLEIGRALVMTDELAALDELVWSEFGLV